MNSLARVAARRSGPTTTNLLARIGFVAVSAILARSLWLSTSLSAPNPAVEIHAWGGLDTAAVELDTADRSPSPPGSVSVTPYHRLREEISSRAGRERQNSRTAYDRARVVVVESTPPWFRPRRICRDTCCAETVAISLDQDEGQIINTVDALDLADVRVAHYEQPSHLRFHAGILDEATLPCLRNGTVISLDNHGKILRYFFRRLRENITVPYVLMTTESDGDSPYDFEERIARDDLLLRWYGSNPRRVKDDPMRKFEPFPLGLSKYHPQDKFLSAYMTLTNFTNPFLDKTRWTSRLADIGMDDIFVRFGVNPMSRRRQIVVDALCGNVTSARDGISCGHERVGPDDIYAAASTYLFGVSPPGAGYDCYRTYELLLLGVIPIVEYREGADDGLFADLPVVQIRDMFGGHHTDRSYVDAARAYVDSDAFRNGSFRGWERLFLRYWRRKVLRDAGREGDIVTDEMGREYYQAWRYIPFREDVYCSEPGNCEII